MQRTQRQVVLRNHPELATRRRSGVCTPVRLLLAGCVFFVAALACWAYVLLHFGHATGMGLLDWSSPRAWKAILNRRSDLWLGAQCTSAEARRLTVPLTLLFVLGEWHQKLGLLAHSENLVVHVIGATHSFEALSDWSALLEFKPRGVKQLTVVLVMGEPALRQEADGVPFGESTHRLNSCSSKHEGLHVMCVEKAYQDFYAQAIRSQWLPAPHLVLLFSALIGSPSARGLEPVLLQLLADNIPIVLGTAEVDERERVERRLGAKWKLGLHAKTAIAVVGRQAERDIPVTLESLDGGAPLDWRMSETWAAFELFT